MSTLQETDTVEKRYNFPKLKGDWEHSCSSSDPSESASAYSSLESEGTSSTQPDDDKTIVSSQMEEIERKMRCNVEQRRLPRRCSNSGLDYREEVFPHPELKRTLRSSSCTGQGSDYVVLLSSDGHYFVIKRKYACLSKAISMFFSRSYPSKLNIMDFDFRIPSLTLHYVCKYLAYRFYYTMYKGILTRPYFPIPSELALDLTVAGYMLKC